ALGTERAVAIAWQNRDAGRRSRHDILFAVAVDVAHGERFGGDAEDLRRVERSVTLAGGEEHVRGTAGGVERCAADQIGLAVAIVAAGARRQCRFRAGRGCIEGGGPTVAGPKEQVGATHLCVKLRRGGPSDYAEIISLRGCCELSSRNVFLVSSSSAVGCTLP